NIHKGGYEWCIEVRALSKQRRPATEAALLYTEDEASRLKRQEQVRERRDAGRAPAPERGRPTKRDRRRIGAFTGRRQ
ncbi:MAG: RNA-binding S4 domain-containing protein, partial [Thiohalocapsa sp.]